MQPLADAAMAWDIQCVTHAPAAWWQQRRDRRLAALLDHVRRHAGARASLPGDETPAMERLARWPVMHKRELMQRFDDWITVPSLRLADLRAFIAEPARIGELVDGRYAVWESSGSSGEPGIFVHDTAALQVYDLLEALRRPSRWLGLGPLAFVGATHGHFASVCTIERHRRQHPWLAPMLRSFSFLQPMASLCHELQGFAPRVLAAYPSMALALAEEAEAGRLQLRLASVWTGGETLTAALRETLERAFGAPVVNSYGASEFLSIAGACDHGALHLNADWVVLEPVDERHRPVPPGQFGHTTLLTNLANRVQPILRYDIGDGVRFLHAHCACGSTMPIIRVQGRCDEVLTLGGRGRPVHLPPLALTTVLEDDASVFDFVLRPDGRGGLKLELFGADARDDGRGDRAVAALSRYLRSQGVAKPQITVVLRPGHAARGRSGKHARVCTRPAGGRARGAADEPS